MLLPLAPLALGAAAAGWYAFDWFGGEGRAEFWKSAILVLPEHDSIAEAHHVDEFYKQLPLIVASSGIVLAYVFYALKPAWPGKVTSALGGLYRLVYRKYYFDEIYDAAFVRPARCLGNILWKTGDNAIIDGIGPDGVAALAVRIARRVSALETGYVYHYAFAMVIGVAAFMTWFWAKG